MIETPLSNTQWAALQSMKSEDDGITFLPSPTGDSLVRMGLAKRLALRTYKITDTGRAEPMPARMRGAR